MSYQRRFVLIFRCRSGLNFFLTWYTLMGTDAGKISKRLLESESSCAGHDDVRFTGGFRNWSRKSSIANPSEKQQLFRDIDDVTARAVNRRYGLAF